MKNYSLFSSEENRRSIWARRLRGLLCALPVFLFPSIGICSDLDVVSSKYAKLAQVTPELAKEQVQKMFLALAEEMKEGNEITINNFGTFYVRRRPPREARNPRTGEKIQVGEKGYPRFRASKNLQEGINTPTVK